MNLKLGMLVWVDLTLLIQNALNLKIKRHFICL